MRISLGIYEKAMPNFLSFREKFRLAKEAGFDYMEISIDESDEKLQRLDYTKEEISEIKKAMEEEDFFIRTMCLSGHRKYPLGSHDENIRNKSLEIMEKALKLADELGIRIIQLAGYDVYYEEGDEETREYFRNNLKKVVNMAASYGVVLGFETMETEFMDTISKAMVYINEINSPYLGVYPDIGNLKNACVLYKRDIIEEIDSGKGHIFAAHLKETITGVYRNMDFGTGHTEYIPCIAVLLKQGVRIFTGEFWYQGEENYKEKIIGANGFLREKIKRAIELVEPSQPH
ncbi:L-ribulose-5-phosphate 3-epimerase [Tepidimicrobium xylanilyticum]|uniref:L-ribulose-5-phosphate 3-epimerase n=1 Tax=Tepidimicrobium xylanilyticum TaxID=1123352 RepID=A0A1H2RNG3_9FIRM|nr:L-ribulose-5-phosphate 3-epimerase [Tepidimicrobium xylanilyticum]SDW20971.1 L-ribulose-5-phosphate 3-epimerase [Tepidimicrobium xylanilyticum]